MYSLLHAGHRMFLPMMLALFFCSGTLLAQRCDVTTELGYTTLINGQTSETLCDTEPATTELTLSIGDFTGAAGEGAIMSYQWQHLQTNPSFSFVNIPGATNSTYTFTVADTVNFQTYFEAYNFRVITPSDNGTPGDISDDCIQLSIATAQLRFSADECVLPVEWRSFDAEVVTGAGRSTGAKYVDLQWVTTPEPDNAGFHIERSSDGQNWIVVGEQTPHISDSYGHQDLAPLPGSNYYRIRQTDFDGAITYSPVEVIDFSGQLSRVSVFPNPVTSDGFTVLVPTSFGENVGLELFDATGRLIPILTRKSGVSVQVETEELIAGLYFLRLASSDGKLLETVRVMR
ncbi:T9SS type A sorting domain-containing protein [Neolewinella agarilytica]|uniref:T9SS type A sorting domain-containing protein n=1 Tax=Neolewinella agarilytica TaxID=478744 RepID=UPI0023525165|nr:T9SS type A sorting domain-containing protein [Neolewinella agarilytica]